MRWNDIRNRAATMNPPRALLIFLSSLGFLGVAGFELASRDKTAFAATNQTCIDVDGDGYGSGCAKGPDCNDRDATMHPGSVDACGDGKDNDCSGAVDDAPSCRAEKIHADARVHVPTGSFPMGSATGPVDERPMHTVTLAGYFIDRYEITNGRYRRCVDAGACEPPHLTASRTRPTYFGDETYADFPVVFVDWEQARVLRARRRTTADGGRMGARGQRYVGAHVPLGRSETAMQLGELRRLPGRHRPRRSPCRGRLSGRRRRHGRKRVGVDGRRLRQIVLYTKFAA